MEFFWIILIPFILDVSLCCSSKQYKYNYLPISDESQYTLTIRPVNECGLRIDKFTPAREDRDPTADCNIVLPEVWKMAYGFLPLRGKNYDVRIVTSLSCEGGRNKVMLAKQWFDVPNNITIDQRKLENFQVRVYGREDVAESLSKLQPGEIEAQKRFNYYVNYMDKFKKDTITVLRYEYIIYSAKNNDLEATAGLAFAYRNLYKQDNKHKQLEFLQNYGIGIREEINVGGVVEVIWDTDLSVEDLTYATEIRKKLNEYLGSDKKKIENLFIYGGIEKGFPTSLESWTSSVEMLPQTLRAHILSHPDYFDSKCAFNASYVKVKALSRFITDGNTIHNSIVGIETLKCRYALCRFMLNRLHEEKKYVCVDKSISQLAREFIINSNNLRLEKFYINYTKRQHTEDEITDSMRTVYVVPSVCFRRSWKGESKFLNQKTVLPKGKECVKFYDTLTCDGTSLMVTQDSDFALSLNHASSMTIC